MRVRLVIAGGGTGGHLYPGIAVAEALLRCDPQAKVLFVGTARGIEARVLPGLGFDLALIRVEGVQGRGLKGLLRALWQVPASVWQSLRILRRFQATAVLGVGGYASGPVVLAAWLLRIPTAIQEQNAHAGVTNRMLGHIVGAIFTSWPATAGLPASKVRYIGNPIRAAIRPSTRTWQPFTLLVFGGSLGARTINRAMVGAAPKLIDLKDKLRIVHQTGRNPDTDVAAAYRAAGLDADVRPYFEDMPVQYAQACLAICRAGATSLAELAAAELPAILIPFPFAAENHQEKNADVFVQAGAALKLLDREATGERLAALVRELMAAPDRLEAMARAMRNLARPEAASALIDQWAVLSEHSCSRKSATSIS